MAAGVPWRRAWVVLAVVALAVSGVVVAVRADGFAAVDATVPRATRWFLHEPTGRAVLVDGFSGRSLARIEAAEEGEVLQVVQSASGVALVDRSTSTVRSIDASAMRLGPEQTVDLVGEARTVIGFGQPGVVAVDPATSEAVLVPPDAEPVPFTVSQPVSPDATRVSPDGAIWTLADGALVRATSNGTEVLFRGLGGAFFSLVGNDALVLDADRERVRLGDGEWVPLPGDADVSEFVVQQPGPASDCGWIGANDALYCIGDGGVDAEVDVPALDIEGSDLLAIAGDVGVVVRPGSGRIDRVDWRAGRLLGGADEVPSAPPGANLAVSSTVDLVWVDDVSGELVWAIHPWGFEAVAKNDSSSPLLGESGDTIDNGESDGEGEATGGLGDDFEAAQEVEPDNDGVDDPPVATDDQVTSRFGVGVPIVVTANDYDPDGEAIAVSAVTNGARGEVTITSASTVMYSPEVGVLGTDEFSYTIVDGNGTEATATVTVQLLAVDAPNQAPVGTRDRVETSQGTPVIIDVLLNDIDPERDQLRVGSFVEPIRGGTVGYTEGPTDLPAIEYRPPPDLTGVVRFQYVPIDSFGAEGAPVDVIVDISDDDDENRPPLARPDALRIRRGVEGRLPVLANDVDPDGDRLVPGIVRSTVPDGLDVSIDGSDLVIIVEPGTPDLLTFQYTVTDRQGGEPVIGQVLVSVIPDTEPNRPPVANADTETAVVGEPVLLDVLRNDSDPDEDPITLISIDQPDEGAIGTVAIRGRQIEYLAGRVDAEDAVFDRFTYTITDGHTNTSIGEVTVRVLPERVKAPPFARDDAANTEVDEPVVIDVLRNDGDPSGESPTLFGDPGCAGGGTATVTADAQVRFVPPSGRVGTFTCSYEIRNSQGLTARATFAVSVVAAPLVNQDPVVDDAVVVVQVGESVTIDLLAEARDPDENDTLRVSSVTPADQGTTVRSGDTVTYTAPPQQTVTVLTFTVSDGRGGSATGRVSIRVVPEPLVDEPPNAATDRRSLTGGGTSIVVGVLTNDSDPDGDSSKLVVTDARLEPAGAGTVVHDDTTVTITPTAEFVGDIVVTYEITDEDGLTDTGEVLLTVQEILNRSPIARDDGDSVINGGTVVVSIASNDEDPDGDPLTYRLVSGASSDLGSARLDATSLVFEAAPGEAGTATIGYSVSDGEATATALVRITVLPCSAAAPSAPDLALRTGYMQPIAIDLNEVAANGQIVEVGAPLGAPSGVYTPPAGENGNVSFSYTVRNSCRIQDTGVVVIDVNQDPLGTPREYSIGRDATLSIPVDSLASDAEALTIAEIPGAPEWITIAGGTSISVVPAGRAGSAAFTATIVDPGGLSVSVPITITLVNLQPIANPDTFQGTNGALLLDVLANDADPDPLDTIALQAVPATVTFANGVTVALEVVGGDRIRLVPGAASGVATFTYTIVDSQGLPSQPATVTVSVNSPPTAPTVDITVVADGTPQQFPVPATDPDGQTLLLEVLDQAAQLQITVDGLNLTIVAGNGARGNSYALRYRVTDPLGLFAEGVLNINAIPPPTTTPAPPSTQPVEVTMQANSVISVSLPVVDPQGGAPVITIPDNPTPLDITIVGLDVTIDAPRRAGGNTYVLTYVATTPSGGVASNSLTVTVQQD